jgi:hypothetical protein
VRAVGPNSLALVRSLCTTLISLSFAQPARVYNLAIRASFAQPQNYYLCASGLGANGRPYLLCELLPFISREHTLDQLRDGLKSGNERGVLAWQIIKLQVARWVLGG